PRARHAARRYAYAGARPRAWRTLRREPPRAIPARRGNRTRGRRARAPPRRSTCGRATRARPARAMPSRPLGARLPAPRTRLAAARATLVLAVRRRRLRRRRQRGTLPAVERPAVDVEPAVERPSRLVESHDAVGIDHHEARGTAHAVALERHAVGIDRDDLRE